MCWRVRVCVHIRREKKNRRILFDWRQSFFTIKFFFRNINIIPFIKQLWNRYSNSWPRTVIWHWFSFKKKDVGTKRRTLSFLPGSIIMDALPEAKANLLPPSQRQYLAHFGGFPRRHFHVRFRAKLIESHLQDKLKVRRPEVCRMCYFKRRRLLASVQSSSPRTILKRAITWKTIRSIKSSW